MSVKYFNAEYKNISESQYQDEKFKLQVELLKLQEWVVKYGKRKKYLNHWWSRKNWLCFGTRNT